MKKILAPMMIMTLCLTGCNDTLQEIPLQNALTQKELTDYYTQSLNYKQSVEHDSGFKKVEYELNDVDDSIYKALLDATNKVEDNLKTAVWNDDMFVSKDMHQYIKAIIDDKVLTRTADKIEVKESQGHYFVTVKYNISAQGTGNITDNIKHLGVHGAFREDAFGNVIVDSYFTKLVNDTMLTYNTGKAIQGSLIDEKRTNEIIEERNKSIEKNVGGNASNEVKLTDINSNIRVPRVNIEIINKLLGASINQTAVMPALTSVYQPSVSPNTFAGYGIFPQGGFTLSNYGFNRSSMKGNLTMRYVFKKGLIDANKIEFKNAYIVDYAIDDTIKKEPSVIPEFLNTEVEVALDRADRCISNNDLAGLMNAKVFGDVGEAILTGFTNQYGYLQQNVTKLVQVINRDDKNNYLAEISTSRKQGAKGGEDYGCYRYDGYAVITQVGNNFVITDYLYTKCTMTREPQINVDDTIMKRLASLVNSGVISAYDKENIQKTIDSLYDSCNNRYIDTLRDCFNTDTQLLSTTRKEYLVSQLCNWVTAKGVDVKSVYTGLVSEWIGGTDEQAEFITQELIEYQGLDTGLYVKNYYLVSKYGDRWLIDECQMVETKEVYGAELQSIKNSISQKQVFNVAGAILSEKTKNIVKDIQEETKDGDIIKRTETTETTETTDTTEENTVTE